MTVDINGLAKITASPVVIMFLVVSMYEAKKNFIADGLSDVSDLCSLFETKLNKELLKKLLD